MEFMDMCYELFDNRHAMAYRKSWVDIVTNVRISKDKNGTGILTYYNLNKAQIPFVVTKEEIEADDWVCIDDIEDRFCIKNYMQMPMAKEFLSDVDKFMKDQADGEAFKNMPMTYKLRMEEAIALRLLYPDYQHGRIIITDIGYDLIKQLS